MAIVKSKGKLIAIYKTISLTYKSEKERQLFYAILVRVISLWEAIQKRNHKPMYKTNSKK